MTTRERIVFAVRIVRSIETAHSEVIAAMKSAGRNYAPAAIIKALHESECHASWALNIAKDELDKAWEQHGKETYTQ